MSTNLPPASRRRFLQTGTAASALAAGLAGSTFAQTSTPPTAIPTPAPGALQNAPEPAAMIGALSEPDVAIFRFSLANELIGGDFWSQYANQVLYNPAYTAALRAIDPMLPRYVLDTVRDEMSHGLFLTALARTLNIEPVNLDPFRTLPDTGAAALTTAGQPVTDPQLATAMQQMTAAGIALPPPGTRRIVNLTALNLDTSWFNKYRTASNPDLQPESPMLLALQNQQTIPTGPMTGGAAAGDMQLLAQAAVLHMSQNEQTESSTYLALGAFIRNRELLGLMSSILPVEMMHYTAFQTSVARMTAPAPGSTTPPAGNTGAAMTLRTLNIGGQANSIPLPVLPAPAPVYAGLPPVSVVRPRRISKAGAVATAQKLVAANYFAGQPATFMDMMMTMARAADSASVVADLATTSISTVQPEITLNAAASYSGSGTPVTYMLRTVHGVASISGADTATPRVQFNGGPGPYVFELTVTDAAGNMATDYVTVMYSGR